MSGLEIIGLAASFLQIADYGWKPPTTYISATGAVLKQLGDRVEKDVTAAPESRICSHGLITTASKLVEECKNIFTEIDISIGGKDGNKVILGFKQKLKWSYLEPRVEQLRAHLERLKSSLAIMLNVLIYAEQLRSREERTVLTEQQGLVASFASQKADAEKIIEQLTKSVETGLRLDDESRPMERKGTHGLAALPRSDDVNLGPWHTVMAEDTVLKRPMQPTIEFDGPKPVSSITGNTGSSTNATNMFSVPQSKSVAGMTASTTSESTSPPLSGLPLLEQHRSLIEKILEEVNSSRYAIDHGLRYRLHDGILDLHWTEWSPLRSQYGDNALRALLTHSPVLARHWHECLLNETNNEKRKDNESDNGLAINPARPTYIRVHTKFLSSATLEYYSLPWQYDHDPDYIIIKEYINHELLEDLLDHTKDWKRRELLLSHEAISADTSSSKTRSQKQPMLKPISDTELEYLDPDDVINADHTPVFTGIKLRRPSEATLPPLVLEHEPESSIASNMGRGRSRSNRYIGRTRPSQCDAVLIAGLGPNRPEIAAHAGENALNSASQSEAETTQRERVSPLVANRKRKEKLSGVKMRGQNLDGDVIQRHTKRQKTRQRTLHAESDEVLRREDEATDVDENLSPEPGNAADIADYSSHNGQTSL